MTYQYTELQPEDQLAEYVSNGVTINRAAVLMGISWGAAMSMWKQIVRNLGVQAS